MLQNANLLKKTLIVLSFFLLLSPACVDDRKSLESPVNTESQENAAQQNQSENLGAAQNFMPETVYFPFDSDHLGPQEQEKLARLSENMKSMVWPNLSIARYK